MRMVSRPFSFEILFSRLLGSTLTASTICYSSNLGLKSAKKRLHYIPKLKRTTLITNHEEDRYVCAPRLHHQNNAGCYRPGDRQQQLGLPGNHKELRQTEFEDRWCSARNHHLLVPQHAYRC